MPFALEPIGYVDSCFREKFGIPRQSGLAPDARAVIRLKDSCEMREALRGIEEFSHLWVIFVFHQQEAEKWKPLVRPPRLGGARKTGVLATRSPHRPNPIGLSAVKLERVVLDEKGGPALYISGVDLLDETPVLDIKPYIRYADSIPRAQGGWAKEKPKKMTVTFSPSAAAHCQAQERGGYPKLKRLVRQFVSLDPRPAFQAKKSEDAAGYASRILDFDVRWEVKAGRAKITDLALAVPTL